MADNKETGFPFYEPQPYLLVTMEPPAAPEAKPGDVPAAPKSGADNASATPKPDSPAANPVYTVKVIYLPNPERGYRMKIHSGLGNNEHSFKLTDGWQLTTVDSKTNTEIPETITAISGLITAATSAYKGPLHHPGEEPKAQFLEPGLYKIDLSHPKAPKLLRVAPPNEKGGG